MTELIAKYSKHNLIHKVEHYFNIYDRFFEKYRNKPVKILEIGVSEGGSLDMWKEYFGEHSVVYGIDINPNTLKFRDLSRNVQVIIANQEDKEQLNDILKELPTFDIVIDDGGHTMKQQINSIETIFPYIHKDGIYLVEDTQTSYWPSYGGKLRDPTTFIEYSKSLLDYVNVHHFRHDDNLNLNHTFKQSLINSLTEVHFFDGMVLFQKGDKTPKKQYHYRGESHIEDVGPISNLS